MSKELAERFKKIWDTGRGDKGTLENNVQEQYEFFYPSRSDIIHKDTLGSKRHERVFVNVGEDNVKVWANGLLNGIFPTTSVFHELQIEGVQKAALPDDAIQWLEGVARLQFLAFVNSNAYTANYNCFVDEGVAGTSCCYIGESINPNRFLHFQPFSIENYEIVEDAEGMVKTVVVKQQYTTEQLQEMFGNDLPRSIVENSRNQQDKKLHTVYFGCMPNEKYNPNRVTNALGLLPEKQRPYLGIYFISENEILGTTGFYEFPFVVTRINKAYNERYGRAPASSALHSMKMLTQQAEYDIVAVERATKPSYLVDSHSILSPLNPAAGDTYPIRQLTPIRWQSYFSVS